MYACVISKMNTSRIGQLTKRLLESFVWLVITLASPSALAESYVSIQVESTGVHLGPTAKSELIGVVKRSTVLVARGDESEWTRVVMPSGEYRYVLSASIRPIGDLPPFVASTKMTLVCSELLQAERKAVDEAARIGPNIMKQIELERIRSDRYKLAIFAKHGIHPAHNNSASVWCVKR